jgi:hypothetical protein
MLTSYRQDLASGILTATALWKEPLKDMGDKLPLCI